MAGSSGSGTKLRRGSSLIETRSALIVTHGGSSAPGRADLLA